MRFQWPAAIFIGSASLLACGHSPQKSVAAQADVDPEPTLADTQPRVLIIGLDGTRAGGLQEANTPNMDVIIAEGFVNYDAVTNDVSLSGPGWASMLTGVWCDKHDVLDNDLTWANSKFDQFPHFMHYAEQAKPALNTVSVSHWAPINTEIVCADERGGDCAADQVVTVGSDAAVRDEVLRVLSTEDPHVLFMQFDDIDHAGHGSLTDGGSDIGGFCPYVGGDPAGGNQGGVCTAIDFNQQYLDTITVTDGYIGEIMAALKARPNYVAENWLVLASPDHGGAGTVKNQHGFPTPQEMRTFFVSSGEAARAFPDAQIKIVDIAATALHHLGVAADSAWQLDGRPVAVDGAPAYIDDPLSSCYGPGALLP